MVFLADSCFPILRARLPPPLCPSPLLPRPRRVVAVLLANEKRSLNEDRRQDDSTHEARTPRRLSSSQRRGSMFSFDIFIISLHQERRQPMMTYPRRGANVPLLRLHCALISPEGGEGRSLCQPLEHKRNLI